jgi:hypothetical protein
MFDGLTTKDARSMVLIKGVLKVMVGAYLIIGLVAGYRAWFQIKSLELRSTGAVLRQGSTIENIVVSYARVPMQVRLELIQGTHSETFALQHVPKNSWAFLDPRTREASQSVVIAADVLDRFAPGEARVRATATGRLQLGHLPAPLTRDVVVKIGRE